MPDPMMPRPRKAMRIFSMMLRERLNGDGSFRFGMNAEWVAQRASKAGEFDEHFVAIFKLDARAEAQAVCAEVVNMHVAGPPVALEFEMVVLDVGEAVAHFGFAGGDFLRPK